MLSAECRMLTPKASEAHQSPLRFLSQFHDLQGFTPTSSMTNVTFCMLVLGCNLRDVMSNHGRFAEDGNVSAGAEVRKENVQPEAVNPDSKAAKSSHARYPDMQSAVR